MAAPYMQPQVLEGVELFTANVAHFFAYSVGDRNRSGSLTGLTVRGGGGSGLIGRSDNSSE